MLNSRITFFCVRDLIYVLVKVLKALASPLFQPAQVFLQKGSVSQFPTQNRPLVQNYNTSVSLERGCGRPYQKPWRNPGRQCPLLATHQASRLQNEIRFGKQDLPLMNPFWFSLITCFNRLVIGPRRICSITFLRTEVRVIGI